MDKYFNARFVGEDNSDHQQLRFFAKVVKINEQTIDPAHNKILLRKFINPKDFLKYCPWGNTGKAMLSKSLEILDNL